MTEEYGKETEEWALEEAEREKYWQETYGTQIPKQIERMNDLLRQKTEESRWQLHSMFLDKEYFDHYKQVDVFATMYVIMSIYETEQRMGIFPTILEQGETVEELERFFFQLKMMLFRLDFQVGEDIEQELLNFIEERHVSMTVLNLMLTTVAVRPLQLALRLEELFHVQGMEDEELNMLVFINDHWKENYRVIERIAQIAERRKSKQVYEQFMEQMPEGVDRLESGQEREKYMQLQELFWKRVHKEEVREEIAQYLRENTLRDETFQYLLQTKELPEKADYYYLLNASMEDGKDVFSKMLLLKLIDLGDRDEVIVCLLAQIYLREGDPQSAERYLKEYKVQGKNVERLLEACRRAEG